MQQQTHATLNTVFQDVFGDDSLTIHPALTAADVDGWDSLAQVRLIVSVERKFKIRFTASEVGKLKNVGELMELIDSKLVGRS